jgi:membrane-associated PAP2 superfamily phosphatase
MSRGNVRSREFRLWLLACGAIGLIFGLWPALDLRLAGLFYDSTAGIGPTGFVHADQPLIWTVYKGVPRLGWLAALVGLLAWAWPTLRRIGGRAGPGAGASASAPEAAARLDGSKAASRTAGTSPWRRRLILLLVTVMFGLVLAVNGVLKEGWGRPRPEQVSEFGGAKVFQPWWQPSRQCASNCSFVTGHGATGAVLLGIGLLSPAVRRRRWLVAGWAAGLAIGLVRMIQGGHFASDVLFACLVIWGVGIAIRRVALISRLRRWRR